MTKCHCGLCGQDYTQRIDMDVLREMYTLPGAVLADGRLSLACEACSPTLEMPETVSIEFLDGHDEEERALRRLEKTDWHAYREQIGMPVPFEFRNEKEWLEYLMKNG